MKTNHDSKEMFSQDSIIVALQELKNDDTSWIFVQSKKNQKLREKERLQYLAQIPSFPTVNEENKYILQNILWIQSPS